MEINRKDKTLTISQNTGVTVSLALVIMFSGAVFTGATWLADVRNRISNIELTDAQQQTDISRLKSESTTNQVKFSEIQTQLKSIDSTLVEIKDRLK